MQDFPELHQDKFYYPSDPKIMEAQAQCVKLQNEYNKTEPGDDKTRQKLLKQMFCELGENCYVEPPLKCNWGGHFIHLGNNVYINFDFTAVDDTHIYIGDNVMIGPKVIVATATHPEDPTLRAKAYQKNSSVKLGNNVWIGAGAIILPGVTIGENSVIGAGSVVTHDIPANVVAVGNPCKILREIRAGLPK